MAQPSPRRPSPRRPGRPGHNQDAVLTAAVRLFNEKGYEATSISDLAEALHITKSSVYHHVAGKQDLLRLAIDHALDGLQQAAAEVESLDAPAIERLELLIRRSVLVLAYRLEFVTLLLRVRGNNAIEQSALMRRRVLDAQVTDLVKEAQAAGDLRADIDPATAARLMFGMVNSLTEWYRPRRGGAATMADAVVAMAFEGLRTRQE